MNGSELRLVVSIARNSGRRQVVESSLVVVLERIGVFASKERRSGCHECCEDMFCASLSMFVGRFGRTGESGWSRRSYSEEARWFASVYEAGLIREVQALELGEDSGAAE